MLMVPIGLAAADFEGVSSGASNDLQEAMSDLTVAREQVELERLPLAKRLRDVEQKLVDRKAEYAEYATSHLLPLAEKALLNAGARREPINATVAWTLLPLAFADFIAALPEAACISRSRYHRFPA